MDRSVGSPRTRSVVGVRGPGVNVFGLPEKMSLLMQTIFTVPAMQHGCRAKPLLACKFVCVQTGRQTDRQPLLKHD